MQHRLVYEVVESEKTIKIISMWPHYERYAQDETRAAAFLLF